MGIHCMTQGTETRGLCNNLKGWDVEIGKEVQDEGDICISMVD